MIAPDGLPWGRLRQPDQLSCGAASLVVARMLDHLDKTGNKVFVPRRDESVGERPFMDFQSGYVLRALDDLPGHHRLVTRPSFDRVLSAAARGPVAVYVGNRLLPRHVVLVVAAAPEAWVVYDPARGGLVTVDREQHAEARLPFGRWHRAWWALVPR